MILLKLFLVLVFSVAVLILTLSEKYKTYKRVLLLALYVFIVALIISPTLADTIAGYFSIQYGSDLAVYVAISVLVMMGAINYARGNRQSLITTKLVRELAIRDAVKTKK
jgi:hypothetical protein